MKMVKMLNIRFSTAVIAVLMCCSSLMAQTSTLRQLFSEMPDTLLPILSHNNRLDLLDFHAAGMKAVVANTLEGTTELTHLNDYDATLHDGAGQKPCCLMLQMSQPLRVGIYLLDLSQPVDSSLQAIAMVRTYTLANDSLAAECVVDYYSARWRKLPGCPDGIVDNITKAALPRPDNQILRGDDRAAYVESN